ncbi:hypothetical protein ACFL08_03085 [Patescibacteria group bacterium]
MIYDEIIKELEEYFNYIVTDRLPETEKEFIYTLEFWGNFLVHNASQEYQRPPLGIIPHDTEIDEDKLVKKFNPETLRRISDLVELACEKFDLVRPGLGQSDSKITFENWFNSAVKKYGLRAIYVEEIFNNGVTKS